ncbi:MBL fold metallo-hydrolase [Paenarthrobacter nitroguajacolicus]|uniref:MBL fold metallo-hydrolase n=1 Tax=Paenarthrobacter nitroguajacolicus TaxID=211146 RepID=UPI00248BD8B0|nr:MBL fold metallo-hydrolase [Paenarthrobacter nitroguajacolicus]MDI2033572.1 L-ascorbate-6-phosphate lactonase UlaG [Paenarthrobacter nitroguajacolicus]
MNVYFTVRAESDGPDVGYLTQAADDDGRLRFWWLGQAGFAFEYAGRRILLDPYLSDSLAKKYAGTLFPHTRLQPVPVDPAEVRGVEAVLHSHAHTDHLDPDTVAGLLERNSPVFVAPRARRDVALARHIPQDRLLAVTDGDVADLGGGVTVTAVPAAHEELEYDANGDSVFLGYILDIAGVRIYHSGDCVPYEGQAELLRSHAVDLALLPINGRDTHRLRNGVPGNFTVHEAAALCKQAAIPVVVGHHFGLFDFNTVPREEAARELGEVAGDLQWALPDVGQCHVIEPAHHAAQLEGR